jgi:hypothetical protein
MQINLQIDPVDRNDPLPWRTVVAAFSGLQIEEEPHAGGPGREWKFGDLYAYAPLLGRDGAGLAELMAEGGVPTINVSGAPEDFAHPFWAGAMQLLNHEATYLHLTMHLLKCIIVAPGKLASIPSLFADTGFKFECASIKDLEAVVESGRKILAAMAEDENAVMAWAEAQNVDLVAHEAFKAYVSGKRPKPKSLPWYGQAVKLSGGGTRFELAYAIDVDWRDDDANIVDQVAGRLKDQNALTVTRTDQELTLRYRDRVHSVPFEGIGAERYVTLRALNAILAGDFELRTLRKSLSADTHGVVVAPVKLWSELETTDKSGVAKRFKVIGPSGGFHGVLE